MDWLFNRLSDALAAYLGLACFIGALFVPIAAYELLTKAAAALVSLFGIIVLAWFGSILLWGSIEGVFDE